MTVRELSDVLASLANEHALGESEVLVCLRHSGGADISRIYAVGAHGNAVYVTGEEQA